MSSLMIFAAGFGKRLHPLTLDVPKSLVPIQNIPVLDYILKSYYKKTSLSLFPKFYFLSKFYKTMDFPVPN